MDTLKPLGGLLVAILAHPAQGAAMVAAERRGLPEFELRQPDGRLHADFLKAGWQHVALGAHATDDDVNMAIALAASAGLVMEHKRGLMVFGPEVPQHHLGGLSELVPGHVPGRRKVGVQESAVGAAGIAGGLHVGHGSTEIRRGAVEHLNRRPAIFQEVRRQILGVSFRPAVPADSTDHWAPLSFTSSLRNSRSS